MTAKGKDLIFVSRIFKDGTGVELLYHETPKHIKTCPFELIRLSITKDTYIAQNGFHSYVVKIKQK